MRMIAFLFSKVLFDSRVIGPCPATTDWLMAMSPCWNNNSDVLFLPALPSALRPTRPPNRTIRYFKIALVGRQFDKPRPV